MCSCEQLLVIDNVIQLNTLVRPTMAGAGSGGGAWPFQLPSNILDSFT